MVTAYECVDGVKDWEVKQYLLLGSKRLPSKALSQALLAARGCKGSSWNTSEGTAHMRTWLHVTKHCRTGRPICQQSGDTGHLRRDCQYRFDKGGKSGCRTQARAKNGVFTAKKMNNSQQLEGMSYHCCHTRGSIVG
jgi:LPS sulfotransferase NodH